MAKLIETLAPLNLSGADTKITSGRIGLQK